jgi:hypothetical protein
MHESAIAIGKKQQVDYLLAEIDVEDQHQQISGQAQMSIQNLLNPIATAAPCLSADFLVERAEAKFQLIIKTPDGIDEQLKNVLMVQLQKSHDTKNHKSHLGNEKKKRQNFFATNPNAPESNSTKNVRLEPSQCSKLVALILKENSSQQSSIARMHRWNIQVKFNLSEVRNTSTNVDVSAHMLVQSGAVSPSNKLKFGKYGVIIKDKVCWVFLLSIK